MIRTLKLAASAAALLALVACGDNGGGGSASGARSGIWAAGSSTVFPFATRVAETFARGSGGAAPRVESLGTGGGIQAFCQGVGPTTPDIANASRQMKAVRVRPVPEERRHRHRRDQDRLRRHRHRHGAQRQQLQLRAERPVRRPGQGSPGRQRSNSSPTRPRPGTRSTAGLPNQRIQVYGPPPTSGTRDAFLELGMTPGAKLVPAVARRWRRRTKDRFEALAHTLREDGAWIDSGENDNAIVQTLTRTPGSLGVFGYSFLEQNLDTVKAETIDGVAPNADTIASGEYPLSRSLYIYVKKAHIGVIPGLQQFVQEFLSEGAAGKGGYLADRGLIPLPEDQLLAQRATIAAMTPMARPAK
jgi:phosphate transport system substrate-binding protein